MPLALYLRSAACKFGVTILGCDGDLCPVAIGKKGDCVPTANTAEQYAWCEHAVQAAILRRRILTVLMTGAVHFHLTVLKDKPEALIMQFVLLAASVAVMLLGSEAPKKQKATKKQKRN